jgi:hypothetical protein
MLIRFSERLIFVFSLVLALWLPANLVIDQTAHGADSSALSPTAVTYMSTDRSHKAGHAY